MGYKTNRVDIQNKILFVASLLFYGYGEPVYIFLMIFSIYCNYLIGLGISNKKRKVDKIFLGLGVTFNLLLLGIFKYSGFVIENMNIILGVNLQIPNIILPIGISFYTFQIITYLVDVYRGERRHQNNFFNLALYIVFFPQLIAGPIVQYGDIIDQISNRNHTSQKVERGVYRFIVGLAKKVIIANHLGEIADAIMIPAEMYIDHIGMACSWLGIICYTLQIYYDFSGYSDMAIGLGSIFGFDIAENFNYPYISKNIREFWRRWHMSLSSFFKNYLYIPLGGNRKHLYRNLIIVFFLTGLWHGAKWTFVIWGLWHGTFLIIERILQGKLKIYAIVGHFYTMLVVMIGWVFFKCGSIEGAIRYISIMMGLTKQMPAYGIGYYLNGFTGLILIIGLFVSVPNYILGTHTKTMEITAIRKIFCLLLLIICGMLLQTSSYNPFIYFQF